MDDIPIWLQKYAEKIVSDYSFDSSHDMKHFINVYNYTKEIIFHDYPSLLDDSLDLSYSIHKNLSTKQIRNIIYHAAFCHDLIDSKYVDSKQEIEKLRQVFLDNNYEKECLDIIIFIIDNMSYSKQRLGVIRIPEEYSLIMDIVSDADKLDAYRVERVIAYQENKHKDLDEPERSYQNLRWIKTILVKRILTYKDCWLKTNYAKSIAPNLHDQVQLYVDTHLSDLEMYDY